MTVVPAAPAPVVRQLWRAVRPPQFGAWVPSRSVTVVLPAKDCQEELELTLAGLAEQTYPAELFDVVVVDDGSQPALELPAIRPPRARIVRLEAEGGHGSGRARHAGGRAAEGEVVFFLDADIVPTRTHLEAHLRWHHVVADAVVLGQKTFVDVSGISAADVQRATRDDSFDELLAGRKRQRHTWFEDFIRDSDELTRYADDTFVAVVGASVSVPRALYAESGGFSEFPLRGIVDTEFGYRVFTAGAVIVPERQATGFHQGERSFQVRGEEIKRERAGLAANYLPISLFRPANLGRSWTVPMVRVVVDVGDASPDDVVLTIDSVLASSFTDLTIVVSPTGTPVPTWLRDYVAADARVAIADEPVRTGFPSPYSLVVPAGVCLGTDCVATMVAAATEHESGVVRAAVPVEGSAVPGQGPGATVDLWATRALHRARRHEGEAGLDATARELFGEQWLGGRELGIRRGVPTVTRQGMIVEAEPTKPGEPAESTGSTAPAEPAESTGSTAPAEPAESTGSTAPAEAATPAEAAVIGEP